MTLNMRVLIWIKNVNSVAEISMSASGQTEKNSVRAYVFRFAPKLGHCSMQACLIGARSDITWHDAEKLFLLNLSQVLDDIQYSFLNNLLGVARHIQQ
jgi:hypothetical protein